MGFDYKRYLASREWALKKQKVLERSGGLCERCGVGEYESTHHLTYAHIGDEPMEDLLGVCNGNYILYSLDYAKGVIYNGFRKGDHMKYLNANHCIVKSFEACAHLNSDLGYTCEEIGGRYRPAVVVAEEFQVRVIAVGIRFYRTRGIALDYAFRLTRQIARHEATCVGQMSYGGQ